MLADRDFMGCVQMHERAWGMETYKGRAKLDQILKSKVVAFWYPTDDEDTSNGIRYKVTLHNDLSEIDAYVTHLVWHTKHQLPHARLAYVFHNQKQVKIKGVKVIFQIAK